MSRCGYCYDIDQWDLVRWRGAVAKATNGARGQKLLRELLAALDAMPEKRLIANQLESNGEVCALGCLGRAKRIQMQEIDPDDYEKVAAAFDIAHALAQEIVFMNDDWNRGATPECRWTAMRQWVSEQIKTNAV